jgi:D-threo-aldose 1-dehydrogenase
MAVSARALGRAGLEVGAFAFGVAPLANLGHEVTDEEATTALEAAWSAGVRYFDTAPHYGLGLGEHRLGAFLATKPRDEFLLSTKVGRVLVENPLGMQPDVEGFDVRSPVFVHDPDESYRDAMDGAFPALDGLRREGVIASYGAGMNQSAMLTDFVLNTDLDVVMCAGRYTLLEQGALDDLLPAASAKGVSVVAAAVFNSGLLARDRPAPGTTYDYAPASAELLARVGAIADVCEANGVSLPAAALQFTLGHPSVATVCTGARSAEQVRRNAGLFDLTIPDSLWADLASAGLLRVDAPLPKKEEAP